MSVSKIKGTLYCQGFNTAKSLKKNVYPQVSQGHCKQPPAVERCADVFSGLAVAVLLLGLVRAMLFFYVLVKSTESLHKQMFDAILRAPVHFFDVNPIGRSRIIRIAGVYYSNTNV